MNETDALKRCLDVIQVYLSKCYTLHAENTAQKDCSSLRYDNADLRKEIEDLKQNVLEDALDKVNKQGELHSKLNDLLLENEELKKDNVALKEEIVALNQSISYKRKAFNSANEKAEKAHGAILQLSEQITALKEQNSKLLSHLIEHFSFGLQSPTGSQEHKVST